MKSVFFSAMLAALALASFATPAAAAGPVPEGPVEIYLKNHEDIPLAQADGAIRLTAEYDLWVLEEVVTEALMDVGEYRIVNQETGECLSTDTSGGGETAPVFLADCSAAQVWEVVYDDAPSNSDFRFTTGDGYFLGLADGAAAVEDAEVQAVMPESGASRHFQEWLFAPAPPETPTPSETPSSEAPPSEETTTPEAPPVLPTTGAGLGAAIGGGIVAVAGGTALILWWQRRRALRSDW